jgi:hypothetical protein
MTSLFFCKLKSTTVRLVIWFALMTVIAAIAACANGPHLIDHAFEFDARLDSKDVEVLNYRYGDYLMTRAPSYQLQEGRIGQATGVNGPIPRGDILYVNWRIKSTGELYEDTIDLKRRLPSDIAGHIIYFVINGSQLYVYLITPEQVSGMCPRDPGSFVKTMLPSERILFIYCFRKILQIYPNPPKF